MMAAYGAATSLKNTIQHILQSSRISLVPPSPQILRPAYLAMRRVQKVLLKLDETGYSKMRTKVNALDERIKEAIWEFEDLLESHFTHQILPLLESEKDFSVDLQSLRQSVDCFVERVTMMEAEYDAELLNMAEEEGEPISSRIDFGGINSEMVGLSDEFEQVKDYLLVQDRRGRGSNWLSVIGMAGVGKTAFAKRVFDDPSIQTHFEQRAWVKVGRKCEFGETLRCILAQVVPNTRDQLLTQGDNGDDDCEKLVGLLEERLRDKKCLIVLDDVWESDTRVMDTLPQDNVRILLTSRLGFRKSSFLKLRLLNEEESKKLLCQKVFGEEVFPPHLDLEELGKKIVKKCEGLPLMIVTVAGLLSKEEKTPQFWTEVADKQHNSVFEDAYNQISEVLSPSYEYLPQYLKMSFLYMGAFPPYSDIEIHNLYRQLSAEGFVEPIGKLTMEHFMINCLIKLARWYHLVLFDPNRKSWFSKKEFRVHSCWQYLCKKEASKIKFLHVLKSCEDVMNDQRRLCAHCNTLFAFKQVYDLIKSDCASTARSLLCYGPYHQYPVSIHAMDFKLLRVLVAAKVRFYNIPHEILKLVCLKYLALTCNKELPASISNLFNLQFLIIHPHMHIRKRGAVSYMPVEIWDMQELQHIQVFGRDLPCPNSDAILDKLYSLCGVGARSCSREILKRIHNLKILEIDVELKPYDDNNDNNSLVGLGFISEELQNLNELSYSITNPEMKYEPTIPLSMFPSSLMKLVLSGLGSPWKHLNDIGSFLPNLMILKLHHYAFRGPEWNIDSKCFLKLETLVIEDTDLVQWRSQHESLPRLDFVSLQHCYKLQQLNWTRDPSMVSTTIELVECNPLVVASAMQLRPKSHFKVRCYSSF
ncbi:putative late blight resistance protein homolog R1A-10 [Salvia splendens]|uniref:putative late blight resistance protein homolog R1A-10 n=1 Tax=Salvia splendens TaxID=180675 RepID=UPI001C25ED2A|nr:putative late blight resistance protein homolog R1A-10 [Salvia splendens]XP_042017473.1 putative late blight resistance protein homolog R1A-10 [Salvia splendens]XP_042017474.1 putative late blight resistance protein homolog R1A-10 [Salvia splendens]